jgi:hypothetical protein
MGSVFYPHRRPAGGTPSFCSSIWALFVGEARDECHTPRRRGPAVLPPCAQGRRSRGGAVVQGRSRRGGGEEVAAWARRFVPPPWLQPRRGRAGAMGEGSLFAHADGKQGAARGWPRGSEE